MHLGIKLISFRIILLLLLRLKNPSKYSHYNSSFLVPTSEKSMKTTFNYGLQTPLQVCVEPAATTIEKQYPATEAQLEIWLSSLQSTAANCSYNEISSLILGGQLNVEALQQALSQVAVRNAALRTTFSVDGQTAQVMTNANHEFRFVDLSAEKDSAAAQAELITEEATKPFDLENGPLLRCVLQKLSNTHHKLTFTAHHIIMDGWSLAVFGRDLGKVYDSIVLGTEVDLPPANQYDDYAKKMEEYFASAEGKADEAFWTDQFADSIPVLDLPITNKRPSLRTYSGSRYDHVLSSQLVERVRLAGAKSRSAPTSRASAATMIFVSASQRLDRPLWINWNWSGTASTRCRGEHRSIQTFRLSTI